MAASSDKAAQPPVIGIAGWKNSGKTTLTERLIAELSQRGLKVASIKHAHHSFDIDHAGTDSFRHRVAGAREVAIVSDNRVAHIRELHGAPEPSLEEIVARFHPCDLVIAEGYKTSAVAKIEVRRLAARSRDPLADKDPRVIAIAADHTVEGASLPAFRLDDVVAIADFVVAWMAKRS
jgi:molybdopterin-guanine dinucleotide biosynthesis adapter protein